LHYQDRIDKNFDTKKIIKRFAKYAEVIHLWNAKINEIVEYNHYPALRNLMPEEGWASIEDYIKIIKEENKDAKILFEHASHLISDEELQGCYDWIDELLKD